MKVSRVGSQTPCRPGQGTFQPPVPVRILPSIGPSRFLDWSASVPTSYKGYEHSKTEKNINQPSKKTGCMSWTLWLNAPAVQAAALWRVRKRNFLTNRRGEAITGRPSAGGQMIPERASRRAGRGLEIPPSWAAGGGRAPPAGRPLGRPRSVLRFISKGANPCARIRGERHGRVGRRTGLPPTDLARGRADGLQAPEGLRWPLVPSGRRESSQSSGGGFWLRE
jgi:hypothetical protein